MHSIYPLTEGNFMAQIIFSPYFVYLYSLELWLDWLKDEIKLAMTEEDKSKIDSLFLRATKDYLSNYFQFKTLCNISCLTFQF